MRLMYAPPRTVLLETSHSSDLTRSSGAHPLRASAAARPASPRRVPPFLRPFTPRRRRPRARTLWVCGAPYAVCRRPARSRPPARVDSPSILTNSSKPSTSADAFHVSFIVYRLSLGDAFDRARRYCGHPSAHASARPRASAQRLLPPPWRNRVKALSSRTPRPATSGAEGSTARSAGEE